MKTTTVRVVAEFRVPDFGESVRAEVAWQDECRAFLTSEIQKSKNRWELELMKKLKGVEGEE